METIQIQSTRGIKLSAAFYPTKLDKAIVICHGFTSSKDRARHIQNAQTLHQAGYAVIRFDFAGCGQSEDAEITVKGQVQDLQSVIKFIKQKNYSKIAIVAESLGGLITSKVQDSSIKTMVLWAPVTAKREAAKEKFIIKKNERVVEQNDSFLVFKKDGRRHTIPVGYFQEREMVNQKELLSKIICPVLIIHGNNDTTVSLEMSKRAIRFLSNKSKLEVIDAMDHSFKGFEDQIINLTKDWMNENF
jgi:alpha-beta hydrolase superfamily lysophospholipase